MSPSAGGAGTRWIPALALALGLAADHLMWLGPQGAGLSIWIGLLAAAAVTLAGRAGVPWRPAVGGWSGVVAVTAVLMLWRSSPAVHVTLWVVLLAAASMVVLRAQGYALGRTLPGDHALALLGVPLAATLGATLVARDIPRPRRAAGRQLLAVGRGVMLGTPLLLVFGALFVSADAGFARRWESVIDVSEDLPAHIALVLGFGWIGAGLLRAALPPPSWLDVRRRPRLPDAGVVEVAAALGPLALLFLSFVGLQLGYLFGGRATIEATTGLTLAEYARRGFFELMWVALLLVPTLTAGAAVARRGTARTLFRALGGVLVACVLVVLASAAQRLNLYQAEFGLTVDRILAAAVMAWLAAVLGLFAATVLRGRPARFASGAVVAGVLTVWALAAANPAALAARTNVARAAGGPADAAHLLSLGDDAVPALLEGLPSVGRETRCELVKGLLEAHPRSGVGEDWRAWSAARALAGRRIRAARPGLERAAAGCGETLEETSEGPG